MWSALLEPTTKKERMNMASKTGTMQLMVAILAALALMLGLVALTPPATAQSEGGAGVANGTEEPAAQSEEDPPQPPIGLCLKVDPNDGQLLYNLTGTGTYTGLSDAVYSTTNGPDLDIKIRATTATGPYWINPLGIWDQPNCELGGTPAQIPVDINVNAGQRLEGAVSGNSCEGSGTFARVTSVFVAEWDLDEDCNVEGNVPPLNESGVAPAGTSHAFEGELTPCLPEEADPSNSCDELYNAELQLEGTYQQHLH